MFLVLNGRLREVYRTKDATEAAGLVKYFNRYGPMLEYGRYSMAYLPERRVSGQVIIFPKRR